ncbi:hypothetical protein CAP35_08255 [Chitinophagaceae bacterium IBVUCB1]|nr:hypothetical protein CAP35_08255 [Chitinophagaceae bacterium IBVUCB1]
MGNYEELISRLDAFIRKYYANQLLRGSLILFTCLLAYILTVSVGEYYLYLPVWAKLTVVSLFIIAGLTALVVWVAIPLSKMAKLGKQISHEQAAVIVGRHFPEVSDKLLNILQLRHHADSHESRELALASINQKASQLSVVPFANAIDLGKNKKYLPYLLPLVLVMAFILIAAPNVFSDASARLLQPTKAFEKPAPFRFVVKNKQLQAIRGADYVLQVSTEGNALPADMYIDMGGDRLSMQSTGKNEFQYTFRNVTEPFSFRLYAGGYYSQPFSMRVAQKPVLKSFNVKIDYPDYTGRKDELRTSMGDATIPIGTHISWVFIAEHTDEAFIRFGNGQPIRLVHQATMFGSQFRFMNDTSYVISLRNKATNITDSFSYSVKVIPDEHPVIQLQEFRDTVSGKQILLTGTAGDDYGISKLSFHYDLTNAQNQTIASKSVPLPLSGSSLTSFQYYFDVEPLRLQAGQKLQYYVEAWDNDGVHGAKSTRSEVRSFNMYDAEQIDSAINANAEQINAGLSNSAEQTKDIQSEYKDLQSKLLESNDMGFEQKQNLQQLANMQQQLKNQLEAVKKRLDEQIQQSQQKPHSDDLKEKQQELQKQMDNLLNKELREQMKKLQELMQRLNKDKAFETMKQLEQENKLFNMDLKRMQELMKKMEMQMRMEDLANKMEKLAEKQLDLKAQTEKGNKDNQQLAKEQDALKKELDEAMKEEMKQMEELNKEMQQQQDLAKEKDKADAAKQDMQDSKQQMEQGQKSQSGKSQGQAAQNLQSMAQSLRAGAGGMSAMQLKKDIRAVRQILTNLVRLSFDQEQLMKKVQVTNTTSQAQFTNLQEQKRLHANSRMIRDSLYDLSKNLFKLAPTINKETTELEKHIASSISLLEKRRRDEAMEKQQYAMMHTNNLALMLNEVLANLMQQQSQSQSSGQQGQCKRPGGKTPKPGMGKQLSDIITKQQELGNAMQQMQNAKQQREGQQGQESKDGQPQNAQSQPQKEGEYGNAQQLAQMAQQQAAIRRQLQQLNSLLNSKGMGNAKELKEIQDKMDKTETELVNKRMSAEMIMRQKEILTKLLQAEKSLREQEQDDKRSSRSADDVSKPIPAQLQQYINDNKQLNEQYKTAPAQLKPYYRNMVQQYYQSIGNR